MRTGGQEKIYSKVAKFFYLKVPKLVNLLNRRGEKFEVIISSSSKSKLQQDQEKMNRTNKNQIKLKQTKKSKIKTKATSKHRETKKKNVCQQNKLMMINKY